jgi:hypothetical protein
MQKNEATTPFIFYLTLQDSLPNAFYTFDRTLKDLGFILVPVKVDQLQSLLATSDQEQIIVISSITDVREMKLYNEKVRRLLKYLLKSKRLTFMHLSSFSKLSDAKSFAIYKNYYFLKYPLDARKLSDQIARYHDLKLKQNSRWPGGTRAGVRSVAA